MDITSVQYLLFVAISLLIYWNIPSKFQWILLLIDSTIFYFFNAENYTVIYLIVSIVSVFAATQLFTYFDRGTNPNKARKKKLWVLVASLVVNFGMLIVLKYTNLFIHTWNFMAGRNIEEVNWSASLAISFYTLQITSYLLECYWGIIKPQNNIFKLSLFTAYFPQMISGPISKYSEIGNSLFEKHGFDYDRVTNGMKRIAWGLMKKLAIANRVGIMVDRLWNNLDKYYGIWIWVAIIGYVIQLYSDFSGCMDIIIGTSDCFGIRLPENFKAPLFSKNIQEFWHRWHITLGRWLREYIMNPLLKSKTMIKLGDISKKKLGKKKGKKIPVYMSMLVLWATMGIWHGNSWKYVIGEGLWFWIVIVIGQLLEEPFKNLKKKLHIKDGKAWDFLQIIRTNLIFAIGMLFFRADSLSDALLRIKNTFPLNVSISMIVNTAIDTTEPLGKEGCLIMLVSLALMFIYDAYVYKGINITRKISEKNFVMRWGIYTIVILCVLLSFNVNEQGFAYAQF